MNYRFNHPPRMPVPPQQEYFSGNACHCRHSEGKSKVKQVKLNVLGLPLRAGTGLCSYYMNRGICKFGTNCKFDHPDPGSDHEKWVVSSNANQVSSQVNIYSVLDRGESNERTVTSEEVHQVKTWIPWLQQITAKVSIAKILTILDTGHILKDVINLIFEKVVAEPAFRSTYAQICTYLNQNLTPFPPEDCGEEITFEQALSNKCQEIFESARTVRAEIDKLIGQDREMEQRDKERVVKLETLANIHFIRALLKKKLITNKIIDHIVQAVMECGRFRFEPLGKVDLLNIIFEGMLDSDSAGAESNICFNAMIGGNKSSIAANDVEMTRKNVNRQNEEAILQKSYNEVPNNSMDPQKNYADGAFSYLVGNEKPTNFESSVRISRAGCSISEIMELVVDAGAVEGSDEHFIATLLFIKPEYREIFLTLDTRQGRLGWLKRMYKVKE